jgi:glutamate formiminotransferase
LERFREIFGGSEVRLHYCQSDVDHNRTVTAFSGESDLVTNVLLDLCEVAFDIIDLNRHSGVHPRVGALDVCPFILREGDLLEALAAAEYAAAKIATRYEIPVYLYEKSERGRHESDLPSLRRGGFGSLLGHELHPDFGPTLAHPRLGVTITGVRDPLIAANINFALEDPKLVKHLAHQVRELRSEGDERFLGVRAMGLPLASKKQTQLSLNLTLPDLVAFDDIVDWAKGEASRAGIPMAGTELIGVIRQVDLIRSKWLKVQPEQVIPA